MFNKCFIYFFIEPECLAFTDLSEKVKFDLFVSFHSGIKHIYIPFAGKSIYI